MKRQSRFEQVSLEEVAARLRESARKQLHVVRVERETAKHEPYHVEPRDERRSKESGEGGVR